MVKPLGNRRSGDRATDPPSGLGSWRQPLEELNSSSATSEGKLIHFDGKELSVIGPSRPIPPSDLDCVLPGRTSSRLVIQTIA